MINLKTVTKKKIFNIVLIIYICAASNFAFSSENRIIFKINDKVFTLLDLEKRIRYLEFVGSNENIDKKIIIDDYISANLFYEYYKRSDNQYNYENKLNEIYENIFNANKINEKEYSFQIDTKNILQNIEIDFVRKIILENIFNSSINNLETTSEEIDLLYNLKIKYISFDTNQFKKFKDEIKDIEIDNFENFKLFLNKKNIKYLTKEKEINDIKKIDKRIKKNILLNKKYFIIEKIKNISVIFIEKSFETHDGIIANLYSIKSKIALDKDFLKCDNLFKQVDNINIVNKEYKLVNLNNELKNNLINVNDFVKYIDNDENIYIVLCNIKFDKEILKKINLNKIINLNINEIEEKFINKYSKLYNLIKLDE